MSPEGVVVGGWSYAIAAYVITAVGLIAYAFSLITRKKDVDQKEQGQ